MRQHVLLQKVKTSIQYIYLINKRVLFILQNAYYYNSAQYLTLIFLISVWLYYAFKLQMKVICEPLTISFEMGSLFMISHDEELEYFIDKLN